MILFSSFLISTITTILLMPILINLASKANIVDIPDDRKIHCDPTPRIGGVAMALASLIPIILWTPVSEFVKAFIAGSLIVVLFGLLDDIRNIGIRLKFAGQIIAALIVVLYGGLKIQIPEIVIAEDIVLSNWISIAITVFIIVAVTNAINLSDGLDGLAGGITLLTFLCIGYISYLNDQQTFEVISVAMIGSIFGLLRYNTHPATVFMGDAGSQLLGFVAIILSLALTQKNSHLSPVLPIFIIGLPVIDTLSVIIQRIAEGKSPFIADKNHLHHKLMSLGFYHSESVILIYIFHAISVCFAFLFRSESMWTLIFLYTLYAGSILTAISLAHTKGWSFKRYAILDKIIKGKLQTLKEEQVIIKISFKATEFGFNFLIIFTCFLPQHINIYISISAMFFLTLILVAYTLKEEWSYKITEVSIFLMIPFLAYLSETDIAYLKNTVLIKAYSLSFGMIIFSVLLTLKFTRRRGFKTTPLDILILLIAIMVPNLPDEGIKRWHMGFVAAKIIALFFTYEILKAELRLNTKRLGLVGILALLILSIRGFIG